MEYEKLSALMVLVFSPQKWLVSYKICVATVDEKRRIMPSSDVCIQICQPITHCGTPGKPSGK